MVMFTHKHKTNNKLNMIGIPTWARLLGDHERDVKRIIALHRPNIYFCVPPPKKTPINSLISNITVKLSYLPLIVAMYIGTTLLECNLFICFKAHRHFSLAFTLLGTNLGSESNPNEESHLENYTGEIMRAELGRGYVKKEDLRDSRSVRSVWQSQVMARVGGDRKREPGITWATVLAHSPKNRTHKEKNNARQVPHVCI